MTQTSLSIVLPVRGAAGQLPALAAECLAIAARHSSDYELIIVVDGDAAAGAQASRLAATHAPVVALHHRRSLGFRRALRDALRVARGDSVLVLDPRQVALGELPKLLALAGGYAAVFGERQPLPASPRAALLWLAAPVARRSGLRDLTLHLALVRSDLQGLIQEDGPDDLVAAEIAAGARDRGLAVTQVAVAARRDGDGEGQRAALGLGALALAGCLWLLRRWRR